MSYLRQAFQDLYEQDGLLVMGRGLGLRHILVKFIRLFCEAPPASNTDAGAASSSAGATPSAPAGKLRLVLVINVKGEEDLLVDAVAADGVQPNHLPQVLTNEFTIKEREALYKEGGVFIVTSRILIVDLLNEVVDPGAISGFLVHHAHTLEETCTEAFILRMYRQRTRAGFIKAFSEDPEALVRGFGRAEKALRALHVQRLYVWPRFRAEVSEALEHHKPELHEWLQDLTTGMAAVQQAVAVAMDECLRELRRRAPSLDIAELTVENGLFEAFDASIRRQLDAEWHRVRPETRQLVSDLTTLRRLLDYLFRYDCVTFYSFLQAVRSAAGSAAGSGPSRAPSMWLSMDAADRLFEQAKARVFRVAVAENGSTSGGGRAAAASAPPASARAAASGMRLVRVLEPNPKWRLVDDILRQVREEHAKEVADGGGGGAASRGGGVGAPCVLIMVKDESTAAQLQEYLSLGAGAMMRRRFLRFLSNANAKARRRQAAAGAAANGSASGGGGGGSAAAPRRDGGGAATGGPAGAAAAAAANGATAVGGGTAVVAGNDVAAAVLAASAVAAAAMPAPAPAPAPRPGGQFYRGGYKNGARGGRQGGVVDAGTVSARAAALEQQLLLAEEEVLRKELQGSGARATGAGSTLVGAKGKGKGTRGGKRKTARGDAAGAGKTDSRKAASAAKGAGGAARGRGGKGKARGGGSSGGGSTGAAQRKRRRAVMEQAGAQRDDDDAFEAEARITEAGLLGTVMEDGDGDGGGGGEGSGKGVYAAPLEGPHAVVCTYTRAAERLSLLEELQPRWVITYDPDVAFVRELELYAARTGGGGGSAPPLTVHFAVYRDSAEHQRFLTALRKEAKAFETLIEEKGRMVVPVMLVDGVPPGAAAVPPPLSLDTRTGPRSAAARRAAKAGPPLAVVDVREFRSALPSLLHARGFRLAPVTLGVGDYVLSPDVCVERKSVSDLFSSFASGRLWHQAESMSRWYRKPALLIEFSADRPFCLTRAGDVGTDIRADAATSKMALLTMNFPQLRVLWSRSPHATVDIFELVMKNEARADVAAALAAGSDAAAAAEDGEGGVSGTAVAAREVLLRLPGVNAGNFRALMRAGGSVAGVAALTLPQLTEAMGGRGAARQLYNFFRETPNL